MAKYHYQDSPTEGQRAAFKKYLSEDEELILVTGFSSAYLRQEALIFFLFPGIILGIVGGGIAWFLSFPKLWILGIVIFSMIVTSIIKTWHLHHSNRYILTTRRIMVKKGIFSVKLLTALFDKITHIEVDQSMVDRFLLHHGNIIINTAGMSKNEFVLKYVDYPIELKNLLERLINREREQMGRKFEPLSAVEGEVIS